MLPYEYMTKEYYSTIEAANIFRVSRKTIFMWIKTGKIKATKVGRNFIVPHSGIIEKLGKTLGTEKKAEIEESIDRAMKDYEQTFRQLGKE
jgi:excisionase family DNA binding protein